MLRNYKITLEYDGSRYNGWQKQGNTDNTLQGKLETIFSKYLSQDVELHGSGRTDAGVHALGQVASFRIEDNLFTSDVELLKPEELLKSINGFLPEDIRILTMEVVDNRFHARLNAKQKTYRYCICITDKKSAFNRKYCMALDTMPDIEVMKAASEKFLGTHDLACFSDTKTKKSTVRRIDSIDFATKNDGTDRYIYIDFTGNGFLYHTVRLITGTLISIGLGKNEASIIDEIFNTGNRKMVPFMAPAEGLFLVEVGY